MSFFVRLCDIKSETSKKYVSYFSKLGKLLHKTHNINSPGWNGGGRTKFEIDGERSGGG